MEERNEGMLPNNDIAAERQQEKKAILDTMEKINKNVREASSCVVAVSMMGIVLAALMFFAPNFAEHPLDGIVQVLYSLIFLSLSIGIYKRNRVCALIALIIYAADTVFMFIGTGAGGNWIMRAVFIYAFWMGVRHSFKFHTFAKQHIASNDADILAFIQTKPKMTTLRRVVYISVAVIGVLVGVAGTMHYIG